MKFRTDFVTNSSSSSFCVTLKITLKTGKTITQRASEIFEEDCLNVKVSPKKLGTCKSVEELVAMLESSAILKSQSSPYSSYPHIGPAFNTYEISKIPTMIAIKSIEFEGEQTESNFYITDVTRASYTYNLDTGEYHRTVFIDNAECGDVLCFHDGFIESSDSIYADHTVCETDASKENCNADIVNVNDYLYSDNSSEYENKTHVIISDGIRAIDSNAFSKKMSMMQAITLPEKLEFIGEGAFKNCTLLSSIEFEGENNHFKFQDGLLTDISSGTILFAVRCGKNEISVPDGIRRIGAYAFSGSEAIVIRCPESLTEIGQSAFENARQLESIEGIESVSTVGEKAFENCLSIVALPSLNVDSLPKNVFTFCCGLKSYRVPEKTYKISTWAFSGCRNLEEIHITAATKEIESLAFSNCKRLTVYAPVNSSAHAYAVKSKILFSAEGTEVIDPVKEGWDELFDWKIAAKGYDIFKEHKVHNIYRFNDIFIAEVEGTETYDTAIQLENREIKKAKCSCQYNGLCKHIVSLVYAANQGLDIHTNSVNHKGVKLDLSIFNGCKDASLYYSAIKNKERKAKAKQKYAAAKKLEIMAKESVELYEPDEEEKIVLKVFMKKWSYTFEEISNKSGMEKEKLQRILNHLVELNIVIMIPGVNGKATGYKNNYKEYKEQRIKEQIKLLKQTI